MSIIQTQKNITKLQSGINTILEGNTSLYNSMINGVQTIFNAVWNDPNYTAQQIFDSFGTDSVKLFQGAEVLYNAIIIIDPTYKLPTPPFPVIINPDGTVIVNYPTK